MAIYKTTADTGIYPCKRPISAIDAFCFAIQANIIEIYILYYDF
jgi:hypothetical protein